LTRPIIAKDPERRLFGPWWIEMSARIYGQYVMEGRLPLPGSSLPEELARALQDYRNRRNTELEDATAAELASAGYRTLVRIDKPSRLGLEVLSGEIDVVAARPGSETVWLLECKDTTTPHSPMEVRRAWDKFNEQDGWIDRLLRKRVDLQARPDAVARAVGASESASIKPMVVTRLPSVAAFARIPRVPFTTLEGLLAALDGAHIAASAHDHPSRKS
jgi:hypothetical protein